MCPMLRERHGGQGVTLLGGTDRPSGVTLAFTERAGGISTGAWSSLNLGSACGDDPAHVAENRRRVLEVMGFAGGLGRLVVPRQVHGDHVVCVTAGDDASVARAREEAAAGADAIVCTVPDVAAMLCFADCVPVVLTAPGGYAVVHSGWKGTLRRIAATALAALCAQAGAAPQDARAYIGPHIMGEDYEVSAELLDRFVGEFGPCARASERHLDLGACVRAALADAGLPRAAVEDAGISTPRATDRFYSYRAERGACGRHAAVAFREG